MSKIAIAIMSANNELANRNVQTLMDTYVKTAVEGKEVSNEYAAFIYEGDETLEKSTVNKISENVYTIKCACGDGIYWTYEKTVIAYNIIKEIFDYDILLRGNISCYVNIRLFDRVVPSLNPDLVYCNVLNMGIGSVLKGQNIPYNMKIYPRGDFYIMSRKVVDGLLEYAFEYMDPRMHNFDHVDDVIIGLCLADYFGDDYYKHLRTIRYAFFPGTDINLNNDNVLSIGYRLKSTPKGKLSGYSWDDNDYRKMDIEKMKVLDANMVKINEPIQNITDIERLVLNDENGDTEYPNLQHNIVQIKILGNNLKNAFGDISTYYATKKGE